MSDRRAMLDGTTMRETSVPRASRAKTRRAALATMMLACAACGVTTSPSVGQPYDTRRESAAIVDAPEPSVDSEAEDTTTPGETPDASEADREAPEVRGDAGPPYPIILHHGFAGFRQIGPINYFYNVARDLRSRGEAVYESEVSPYLPPDQRAYELARVVDRVRRETGRDKVVLIAHSQGGLDARYLISTMRYADRVALLATVATPHRGTYVADVLIDRVPSLFDPLLDGLVAVLGFSYNDAASRAEFRATLEALSERNAAQFNRDNPDDPRVAYWSWTGRSNRRRGDEACNASLVPNDPSRVDDVNTLLAPFATVLERGNATLHVNDGMVEVQSARWGTFMGCVPADHFDEVGQIAHAGPVAGSGFDHLLFYRSIVERARDAGY